jgi:oligopeptidase A
MHETAAKPARTADNPWGAWREAPPFDRLRAPDAVPAITAIVETAERQLQALEQAAQPTWAGLMEPLAELEAPLEFAWGMVQHMLGVMNSPAWRAAHEALQPQVVAFRLRRQQSPTLYRHLKSLCTAGGREALHGVRQRVAEAALREAELSGVGLTGVARTRFNAIQENLARESTAFSNAVLDASKNFALTLTRPDEVAGLPSSLRAAAAAAARAADQPAATTEQGPWRITLEMPLYMPFMEHSSRSDLREKLYRAYITRASSGPNDNRARILEILAGRREAAGLLGYPSYAALSLTEKMADSVAAVDALLESLRAASRSVAVRELHDLTQFARHRDATIECLNHWDVAYQAEIMREAQFGISSEALRPYFPLPTVLDGLFGLCRRLFGIEIHRADGALPVWHPDVQCFRIDDGGVPLAWFCLDPYSRPQNKRGGAWMNPARPRWRHADGSIDLPTAYLVCNQTLPQDDRPSLMTFTEVKTLFHEFGHALQHLLTVVDDPRAAGIHNIEWDAVEVASQFMENWCYHWPTVQAMTAHIDTGAPLPRDWFDKLCAARTFRAASAMSRQLTFAALDMELHHRLAATSDPAAPDAVKQRVAQRFSVMAPLPEDRFLCAFTHIFSGGYAAGYYSYKWAEVLAADAFAAFEEGALEDETALRETGRRFRDTFLALGGGRHPGEVFKAFRGRAPQVDALLRQAGLSRPNAG